MSVCEHDSRCPGYGPEHDKATRPPTVRSAKPPRLTVRPYPGYAAEPAPLSPDTLGKIDKFLADRLPPSEPRPTCDMGHPLDDDGKHHWPQDTIEHFPEDDACAFDLCGGSSFIDGTPCPCLNGKPS